MRVADVTPFGRNPPCESSCGARLRSVPVACERDLEGLVAKCGPGTYRTHGQATSRLKVKNPDYTQMRDRHELFAAR